MNTLDNIAILSHIHGVYIDEQLLEGTKIMFVAKLLVNFLEATWVSVVSIKKRISKISSLTKFQ